MRESEALVTTLKRELRKQGRTYADLTQVLGLSHASVKRLFAEKNFTLSRIELVCNFLQMDFSDLVRSMDAEVSKIDQLTLEQEFELVKDSKLLCMAHALLNKWSFEEIVATYTISELEGVQLLAKLDRMKLIEMQPGNRVRLLVSRKFSWISAGPIQKFFEQQLQADYFDSTFNKEDESRLFVSAMLSRGSRDKLKEKLQKLADEMNDMHLEDEKLGLDKKKGTSMVLALRPWETKVFTALRRA